MTVTGSNCHHSRCGQIRRECCHQQKQHKCWFGENIRDLDGSCPLHLAPLSVILVFINCCSNRCPSCETWLLPAGLGLFWVPLAVLVIAFVCILVICKVFVVFEIPIAALIAQLHVLFYSHVPYASPFHDFRRLIAFPVFVLYVTGRHINCDSGRKTAGTCE